jgi:hypothetical protein
MPEGKRCSHYAGFEGFWAPSPGRGAVHQERHGAIPPERVRGAVRANIHLGVESHDDLKGPLVYLLLSSIPVRAVPHH